MKRGVRCGVRRNEFEGSGEGSGAGLKMRKKRGQPELSDFSSGYGAACPEV
jgi:hypothetical protein